MQTSVAGLDLSLSVAPCCWCVCRYVSYCLICPSQCAAESRVPGSGKCERVSWCLVSSGPAADWGLVGRTMAPCVLSGGVHGRHSIMYSTVGCIVAKCAQESRDLATRFARNQRRRGRFSHHQAFGLPASSSHVGRLAGPWRRHLRAKSRDAVLQAQLSGCAE